MVKLDMDAIRELSVAERLALVDHHFVGRG